MGGRTRAVGLAALLIALNGCRSVQSTFQSHGPAARSIAGLSWFMTILFLIITLVMWGLVGYAFYRRRGSLAEHEPISVTGGQAWIAIGGIAVPLLVLGVLFVLGLQLLRDFPIHGMHGAGKHSQMQYTMKPEIRIIGHQWWWEIHYLNDEPSKQFTTANELHLPVGRPVNIEVETRDVMHSFWVPALHGKVDLIPGQPNYIRLEASQAGEYEGQCAEFCGEEHSRMRLLAVAQPQSDYQAWLAGQRKAGAEPTTADAVEGQKIFLSGPCAMCHQVRGTIAGGRVAPDLTHLASRQLIAANSYKNNDAYLEAWITHAQSLKPGAEMPNLTQFSGEQLHDLVAYLRQLQ
ncbi:cytochrome c oxidase subunit II [Edaphobacter sp. HDX4]|uniref:cytochrome c oxidase subunit II n=1 Tax=Edaphobacter sp. HDX4 TaxID=2794064 RepID=UPI002FE5DB8F